MLFFLVANEKRLGKKEIILVVTQNYRLVGKHPPPKGRGLVACSSRR